MAKDRPTMATAGEVIAALRQRYPANAYAFLEQVGDSTGARTHRWCDALVMSLWPSRGLAVTGFEVKVRRSDWAKELLLPEKADAIARYCDYWYLVVGDENIVQNRELPPTWGLMVPSFDAGKLNCKKEAACLEPRPLDRGFVASVLRQTTSQLTDTAKLAAEYLRGKKAGRQEEKRHYETTRGYAQRDLNELREKVAKFEKVSGVRIDQWRDAGDIGHAVQRVLAGYDGQVRERLQRLREQALGIAKAIEAELAKDESAEVTT